MTAFPLLKPKISELYNQFVIAEEMGLLHVTIKTDHQDHDAYYFDIVFPSTTPTPTKLRLRAHISQKYPEINSFVSEDYSHLYLFF